MIILYEFIYLEIWLIKQIKWNKTLSKGKIMYTKNPKIYKYLFSTQLNLYEMFRVKHIMRIDNN